MIRLQSVAVVPSLGGESSVLSNESRLTAVYRCTKVMAFQCSSENAVVD